MNSSNKSAVQAEETAGAPFWNKWFETCPVQSPGLIAASREVSALREDLSKNLAVFSYKQRMPCLWVVFVGGTGTGKSTLFNAYCGESLSQTGVERPKTLGPIIYAHRACPVKKRFPFKSFEIVSGPPESSGQTPASGIPGLATVLEHEREGLAHLIVVDTPDLDSVEAKNRQMAEDLYLISDAVVFVTSQEKYADEVPYQFLLRIMEDKKPHFFLLNKISEPLTPEEVKDVLEDLGLLPTEHRVWLIPYAAPEPRKEVLEDPGFSDFRHDLETELSADAVGPLRKAQHSWRTGHLKSQLRRLLELLDRENAAARQWLTDLDTLCEATCHRLIKEEKKRFSAESRQHIQREIRRLFAKYDVLAKPRRYIKEAVLTPLRALGFFTRPVRDDHKNALSKVRNKIDFSPVLRAVENFNRLVLETLSPPEEGALLFGALRQPGVVLTEDEIKTHMLKEQDQLNAWLEKTFEELSRDLPKQKKLGIYSTSVVWGILILSFEIAVGGGFTVLDAVLDSALAPFVTKGAVELFAYHEIQKTARELAKRYRNGLLSVVNHQRERYEECLRSLVTPQKTMEDLEALQVHMRHWKFEPL